MVKRWVAWLKGEGSFQSKNPFTIFGRFILSIWIGIIAFFAVGMGLVFLSDPSSFSKPKPDQNCTVVEYNGGAIDTCDYLSP